jgi:creatinine amidohydrolase
MKTTHCLEQMRPAQIDAEKEKMPAIYVPLGAIEWHGRHNVVGLDSLKAHAQLCRVAEQAGGVVYPPIYTGSLPGNNDDYTYMVSAETLCHILMELLAGFERDGWKKAILLGGHYPNYHVAAKQVAEQWASEEHTLEILPMVENRLKEIRGDHAALDETSMMLDLYPETVDLNRIGGREAAEGTVDDKNDWLEAPKDHPCRGIIGADPRLATAEHGREVNDTLVAALVGWIQTGTIDLEW